MPGTREYFIALDAYFEKNYPYLLPFLELESLKGKTVLEIGLGSGFTLHHIAEVASNCYGVDISEKTVQLCKKRTEHFGLDIQLINASSTAIPLPDNSIDVVVSIGCLHHIPEIQLAVDEIYRLLKPGGYLKGMVYNRNSWRFLIFIPILRRLHPRWRKKHWQECVNELYDGIGNPYGMVYSKTEVRHLLKRFTDIRFQVENFVGGEIAPIIGGTIPRNFWLQTMGKIAGLDLYFAAKKAE